MQHDIYLDANATTPVLPAAAHAAMRAMQSIYGNPSSSHMMGLQAQALMEEVRTRASRLLDTGEGRLVFVSGATEAIQTAVFSALLAIRWWDWPVETIQANVALIAGADIDALRAVA